jgi:hypothetical protein
VKVGSWQLCRGWILREPSYIAKIEEDDGMYVHVGDNNIAPANPKTHPFLLSLPAKNIKTLKMPSPNSNQAVYVLKNNSGYRGES